MDNKWSIGYDSVFYSSQMWSLPLHLAQSGDPPTSILPNLGVPLQNLDILKLHYSFYTKGTIWGTARWSPRGSFILYSLRNYLYIEYINVGALSLPPLYFGKLCPSPHHNPTRPSFRFAFWAALNFKGCDNYCIYSGFF